MDNMQDAEMSDMPPGLMSGNSMDYPPGTIPIPLNVPPSGVNMSGMQQMPPQMSIPPPPGIEIDPPPSTLPPPPPPPAMPDQASLAENCGLRELRLPVALEQALAFKTERAKQVGFKGEDLDGDSIITELSPPRSVNDVVDAYGDDDEDEDDEDADGQIEDLDRLQGVKKGTDKPSKGRKKKKKKKKRRNRLATQEVKDVENKDAEDPNDDLGDVEIEYVQEVLGLHQLDPIYRQFARIFETFRIAEPEKPVDPKDNLLAQANAKAAAQSLKKVPELTDDYDEDEAEDLEYFQNKNEDKKEKLSKRKLKKLTRLSVAELKQLVNRPDVVEMHDVTARDPKLLVSLKAHRNTVPVPRHWCFKRKYLQGKRGIEKPPFDLPEFIKKTGIMEMRASLQEKEDQRTLKAKMRERARPKLGKIDIDYQKLHDAFFKWQTKPRLTIHGDLYYEGKEFETRLKEKKPGDLSVELRTALGMPVGPNSHKVPPPWLIAMQRYGPPPSYPNLKIPGLNAPIPEACSFGYHAGGWGKPPVDETGKPLYGDVFGTHVTLNEQHEIDEDIDKSAWGELESESEEESEDESEEEAEPEVEPDRSGLVTPAEGLITPSGITSIPAGLETPEIIELRKKKIESEMEGNETPALFQVLAEKRVDRVGGAMMASTHIYDMTGAAATAATGGTVSVGGTTTRRGQDTVEVALDPSELDLVDTDAMAARYEQQLREQQSQLQKEDLSDMLAEHVARQKNKRKRQQTQENKQAKKYKEFKF